MMWEFLFVARTKNVDLTISNILEGHVTYTPEATPVASTSSIQSSLNIPIASCSKEDVCKKDTLCTAAATFPKSAQERMQSFQERKLQLIMNARKRYMDKHGISALASNNCWYVTKNRLVPNNINIYIKIKRISIKTKESFKSSKRCKYIINNI